jgi:hypothetical protein
VVSGGGLDLGDDSGSGGDALSSTDDAGGAATESDGDQLGDAEKDAPGDETPDPTSQSKQRRAADQDELYAFASGVPKLAPDNTATFALRLAERKASKIELVQRDSLPRRCQPVAQLPEASDELSADTLVAEVRWSADGGRQALLFVDPGVRSADVFACGKNPQPLFTTPY